MVWQATTGAKSGPINRAKWRGGGNWGENGQGKGGGGEGAEGGQTLRRVARAYYPRGANLFAQILHRRCPDLGFAHNLHRGGFAHFLHGFSYPRLPTNAAIVLHLRHV